jgi:2-keto-3-deoxy-L-rhamnonate aldolase RhmA
VTRAGERGVAVGIWVPDAASARFWVEHGVRFVTVSNNELTLFAASANLRRSLGT